MSKKEENIKEVIKSIKSLKDDDRFVYIVKKDMGEVENVQVQGNATTLDIFSFVVTLIKHHPEIAEVVKSAVEDGVIEDFFADPTMQ